MESTDVVKVDFTPPALPALTAANIARALVIDSQEMYDFADQQFTEVKRMRDSLEAQRKAIVDPINKAKDAVQALFKPVLTDLDDASGVYRSGMLKFQQDQERKQREAQAELDRKAREESERLAEEAKKAAATGDVERAEVLQHSAAVISAPVATSTYAKAAGVSTRKIWHVEVTDKLALLKAIVADPAYLHFVEIDVGALTRLARSMDGHMPLAGVKASQQDQLAKRVA